jgi:hypothetical protein
MQGQQAIHCRLAGAALDTCRAVAIDASKQWNHERDFCIAVRKSQDMAFGCCSMRGHRILKYAFIREMTGNLLARA